MHEKYWLALDRFYSARNHNPAEEWLLLWRAVEAVLYLMPREARESLEDFWRSASAVDPFDGTEHPAPLYRLAANFRTEAGASCCPAMTDGCCFVFDRRVVATAPAESIQAMVAHEFAHAALHAAYAAKGLALPECVAPTSAHPDRQAPGPCDEEDLVAEMLARWGFVEELLDIWILAVQTCPEDPRGPYSVLRAALPSAAEPPLDLAGHEIYEGASLGEAVLFFQRYGRHHGLWARWSAQGARVLRHVARRRDAARWPELFGRRHRLSCADTGRGRRRPPARLPGHLAGL